jgi:hypothetical protein
VQSWGPFSWAKLADVGFSSSNFTMQDHIQSNAVDVFLMRCVCVCVCERERERERELNSGEAHSLSTSCFHKKNSFHYFEDYLMTKLTLG